MVPIHPTQPGVGNSNRIAKKCKKLKNIIMASFQAKTGRDRLRMREKKIFLFRSIPTRPGIGNSKKTAKKFKKLKNIFMASFQARMGQDTLRMREKKKNRSNLFKPDPK